MQLMRKAMYYHLTTETAWKRIQTQGIQPRIGIRSAMNKETKPCIYLCNQKDVAIWKFLMNLPVVLQIQTQNIQIEQEFQYDMYAEYITTTSIPPEACQRVEVKELSISQQEEITIHLLYTLSETLTTLAIYYERYQGQTELLQHLLTKLKCLGYMLSNIPWQHLNLSHIQTQILEYADSGEYTFCDTYKNTDKRLWNQLHEYPETNPTTCQIYHQFLQNMQTIPDELKYLPTGGWTG